MLGHFVETGDTVWIHSISCKINATMVNHGITVTTVPGRVRWEKNSQLTVHIFDLITGKLKQVKLDPEEFRMPENISDTHNVRVQLWDLGNVLTKNVSSYLHAYFIKTATEAKVKDQIIEFLNQYFNTLSHV